MILGIGTDLIEVERIRRSIDRHGARFLDRIFTKHEQTYCLKHRDIAIHFAARFAAKEAVAKALGTGITQHVHWHDIEIINEDSGKPFVKLAKHLQRTPPFSVHLSLTHTHNSAIAFAILETTSY